MASPSDAGFESARLTLRPLVVADAEAFAGLLDDPRVTAGLPSAGRGCDVARARDLVAEAARTHALGQRLHWALERRDDGTLVGELSLDRRAGEVGLWLGVAYWRQGYGAEALSALVARARAAYGLEGLCACIVRGNTASVGLFERQGFRFAGLRFEEAGRRRIAWVQYRRRLDRPVPA